MKNAKLTKRAAGLIIILTLLLTTAFLTSDYLFFPLEDFTDKKLIERSINIRISEIRSCEEKIPLSEIIPAEFDTVCHASPYIVRELFAKKTGRKVFPRPTFEDTNDFWWLYNSQDKGLAIPILGIRFLDVTPHIDKPCHQVRTTFLSIPCLDKKLYYTFKEHQ